MAEGRPTRVLLVDDHAVFVQGVLRLLAEFDDVVACGIATSAAAALGLVAKAKPDVVLLDNRLPDMMGVELAARLSVEYPTARIVMLAGFLDDDLMIEMKRAGCAAALSKECSIEEIVDEIRRATTSAHGAVGRGRPSRSPFALTARELEVLHAIGRGLTANAMAAELHLSTHTVRNYTQRVLDKLGAHSKAEAVAIAGRYGLLASARQSA